MAYNNENVLVVATVFIVSSSSSSHLLLFLSCCPFAAAALLLRCIVLYTRIVERSLSTYKRMNEGEAGVDLVIFCDRSPAMPGVLIFASTPSAGRSSMKYKSSESDLCRMVHRRSVGRWCRLPARPDLRRSSCMAYMLGIPLSSSAGRSKSGVHISIWRSLFVFATCTVNAFILVLMMMMMACGRPDR